MRKYKYRNLTTAIGDKRSPLRRHLDQQFPNRRELQSEFRKRCGPLLIDGGPANPGTIGTAFDLQIRIELDPGHTPDFASAAFGSHSPIIDVISEIASIAGSAAKSGSERVTLARASWALALTTEVYRAGLIPGTPLHALLSAEPSQFTVDAMLGLAPDDALRQLGELGALATTNLRPHLDGPFHLGPTFTGSTRCPADADLIADGNLIDIKTRLGTKRPATGARRDTLSLRDLYQVVAYALFDTHNAYGINRVGVYSARYGLFISWALGTVLDSLAGHPVDVEAQRAVVWDLLDT